MVVTAAMSAFGIPCRRVTAAGFSPALDMNWPGYRSHRRYPDHNMQCRSSRQPVAPRSDSLDPRWESRRAGQTHCRHPSSRRHRCSGRRESRKAPNDSRRRTAGAHPASAACGAADRASASAAPGSSCARRRPSGTGRDDGRPLDACATAPARVRPAAPAAPARRSRSCRQARSDTRQSRYGPGHRRARQMRDTGPGSHRNRAAVGSRPPVR